MGDPIDIPLMRVPISLPCQARVVPTTGETDAPLDERPELCATDAWWMIGSGMVCDQHLREVLGDTYEATTAGIEVNDSERLPWPERHRYMDHIDPADPRGAHHA